MSPASARRRMHALTIGVLFVFSLFAGQLLRVQGFDARATQKAALDLRYVKETLPATRGTIRADDGTVLASTLQRVTVVADQSAVCTYRAENRQVCEPASSPAAIEQAAQRLAPLLDMKVETLKPMLTGDQRWRVLKREVTPLTWRSIRALGIPGIYAANEPVMKRVYPTSTTAASLVGFVNGAGEPGGGVELMLQDQLAGRPGFTAYQRALDGQPIPNAPITTQPAQPGRDVTLTIDPDLQWYAQNALAQKVNEVDALSGTAVVMNRTGRLLALASYPTFDPNNYGKARGSLSNFAFTDVFEPGSTAKVMTVSAALEAGKVTPQTIFEVPSHLKRSDFTLKDSHDHGTEYLSTAGVMAVSSNMGTVMAGELMSPQELDTYFRRFGMGSTTGTGFPGESRGLFPSYRDWNGSQRYTVMYGQGVSTTALQAAGVFQTIANDGVRVSPQLVRSVSDGQGGQTPQKPGTSTRVVSPETARQMRAMLEGVVSKEGTAPEAQITGYRVAGKTGTADRYDEKAKGYSGYTASFIGMAPADDPQLIVAVIVQRPIKGHYGGSIAGPVFHDVMSYALQKEGVPPTGRTSPPIMTKPRTTPSPSDTSVIRDRNAAR